MITIYALVYVFVVLCLASVVDCWVDEPRPWFLDIIKEKAKSAGYLLKKLW